MYNYLRESIIFTVNDANTKLRNVTNERNQTVLNLVNQLNTSIQNQNIYYSKISELQKQLEQKREIEETNNNTIEQLLQQYEQEKMKFRR
jgi:peroxiredoxin family protein